jgi:HAE1 family hydrophobic/amphiphilic exporter-1
VNWSASRNEQSGGFSSFNPRVGSTLRINFAQPLLRNFGIDQNRANLETTQRTRVIADLQLEQRVVNTEVAVRNAYLNLVAAIESHKVAQQNMDLAETSLRQARARVEVGVSPEIEIIQAEAQVASNRDQEIATEALIDTAEDALRQLIMDPDHPDYWIVDLEPTDPIELTQRTIDVGQAVASALANRLDLLTLLRSLEITDLNIEVSRNAILPQLDLNLGYIAQGTGGSQLLFGDGFPPPVVGETVKSFGSALNDAFTGAFPTWTVGFTFGYPLGRSTAEAALAQSQIQRRQQTLGIQELELQIVRDVREAARQVETSYQRFLAQQTNREATEQQLEAEDRRFAVGLSSTFELQQRQSQLFVARNLELNAMIAYNRALIRFDQVQKTQ